MKKERITDLLKLVAIPALVAVLGLILLVNPDSATVLVANVIGWLLVIFGAAKAFSMAIKHAASNTGGWIWSAAGVILGVAILRNPLVLAESIGRFLGILLMIRGIGDLRKSVHKGGRIIAIVTLIVGAVLILMPMTLTRTILRLCGLVAAVIGVINIAEKLQEMKLLESGDRPDIIDADE